MTRAVLGVDGAPGGWLVAEYSDRSGTSLDFVDTLAPVVERLGHDVAAIAIDMPIGLSSNGKRPVDAMARQRLGPRRSTFFPTPIRSLLAFADYAEANAHSKEAAGIGLSKQAWNLVPKIREVDGLWRTELADVLVEAHPETSFGEMAGSPVLSKKATPEGHDERLSLLGAAFDGRPDSNDLPNMVSSIPKKWRIDAVDALALVWTAQRLMSGTSIRLGGELDEAKRPMQLII